MIHTWRVREHKVNTIQREFARLGRICDVVRITGYSRATVSRVVNDHFEVIPTEHKDPWPSDTEDMDSYPAKEPANMENFGELQYIVDKLLPHEQQVVTEYFVHGTSQNGIARLTGIPIETIYRILRNLEKIDLTGDEPSIKIRGKSFVLKGLDQRNYRQE